MGEFLLDYSEVRTCANPAASEEETASQAPLRKGEAFALAFRRSGKSRRRQLHVAAPRKAPANRTCRNPLPSVLMM